MILEAAAAVVTLFCLGKHEKSEAYRRKTVREDEANFGRLDAMLAADKRNNGGR